MAGEQHQTALAAYQLEARAYKLRVESGEKQARQALAKNPSAVVSSFLSGDEPPAPVLRRYIVNDSTAAALAEVHRGNPNGLLVYRDEVVSLLKNLERHDNAGERGFYLTGWNGDSAYTIDRIGRGQNLRIPAVCLSLLGSTQPGRISEYVAPALGGGTGDDGLLQRFSLMVWPDTSLDWQEIDRPPDSTARREAVRVFEQLHNLNLRELDAQQDTNPDGQPEGIPFCRFCQLSVGLFSEWRGDLERRLRGDELHPAIVSHLAKYRKTIPALALIIHLCEEGKGPVGERALTKALAWSEYLETHAHRVYGSSIAPDTAAARLILDRIRQGDLPAGFTPREVYRSGWMGLGDKDVVYRALTLLGDLGWLSLHERKTGGRPSTVCTVNPRGVKQ